MKTKPGVSKIKMVIELEINNTGLTRVYFDSAAHRPNPGEVAALGKALGYQVAKRTTLTNFEAIALFKTAYASMVLAYATEKGIEVDEEMEMETAEFAIHFAKEIEMRPAPTPVQETPPAHPASVPVSATPAYRQAPPPVAAPVYPPQGSAPVNTPAGYPAQSPAPVNVPPAYSPGQPVPVTYNPGYQPAAPANIPPGYQPRVPVSQGTPYIPAPPPPGTPYRAFDPQEDTGMDDDGFIR